jgi:hypothetical protein
MTFLTNMAGKASRTPGRYLKLDAGTGNHEILSFCSKTLMSSCTPVFMHAIITESMLGTRSTNLLPLVNWRMTSVREGGSSQVDWEYNSTGNDPLKGKVLSEAKLGRIEKMILHRDPEMEANLFLES